MSARRCALVVVLLAIAFYAVSLGRAVAYGFVWDDVGELQHNPAFDRPLADGLRLTQTERTDPDLTRLQGAALAYDSYRPLLFATYWLEIRAWGRSPGAMHAVSIVLGALGILLAALICRRLLPPCPAAIATVVFALNPAQIEAVAYISARADLLAGVFALACVLLALRATDAATTRRAAAWTAAATLAFAASLLCKEANIALPAVVLAVLWATRRRRWWIAAVLVAVIPVYLALRAAVVVPVEGGTVLHGAAHVPGVWVAYARVLALPFDLSIERPYHASFTWLGLAAVAAVGLALAWRRGQPRAVTAGLAWFAALLGPAAVPVAMTGVVADRYVYLAALGAAIAAVGALDALLRRQPQLRWLVIAGAAVWGALLLVVAWRQVPVWHDNGQLYAHAVEMEPASSEAHFRVGYLAASEDRWDAAIPELERAVALDPTNVRALDDLGVGLLRTNRPAQAEQQLLRATAANPAWFRAWANLGLARLQLGEHEPGCADLRRALSIDPAYESARQAYARRCGTP